MRDDRERLLDIVEAIDRIQEQATRGRHIFETDKLVQTWMVHHIEIMGEATRAVSKELQMRCPKIPWREMVAMRNVLAHDYFGIDIEQVWTTVQSDLPALKGQIQTILHDLDAKQLGCAPSSWPLRAAGQAHTRKGLPCCSRGSSPDPSVGERNRRTELDGASVRPSR